jgi:regulator of cell morphogenesis and NO signaling
LCKIEFMFLSPFEINRDMTVTAIVVKDYRTADVFRKYGIEYCCGGRIALSLACELKAQNESVLMIALRKSIQEVNVSNTLEYNDWPVDFLTDYIINVHHHYLKKALPVLLEHITRFADGHSKQFNYLGEMQRIVKKLNEDMLPHMQHEEEVIFPYIKQIYRAKANGEPYASLFVRTLRKPVENIIMQEHEMASKNIFRLRELTNNYTTPENACVSHKVVFSKCREVDNDIVQHVHLENNILFPKTIAIEEVLLQSIGT